VEAFNADLGGTKFGPPINALIQHLESTKDSLANIQILFISDGDASFPQVEMDKLAL